MNKAVTASTSAGNMHGGQESTLLSFYTSVMHWGSVIVAPGYTDPVLSDAGGNPYGFSTKAGEFGETGRKAVVHQAKRLVEIAGKLVG